MALIQCPECGRTISEKAAFCPGCGCPASEFQPNRNSTVRQPDAGRGVADFRSDMGRMQTDPRTELERMADEIVEWCPSKVKGTQLLQKKAGIDLKTAKSMMDIRYKNRPNGVLRNDICQRCGSRNIRYEKGPDKYTIHPSGFGQEGSHYMLHEEGKTQAKCQDCGMKWKF